MPIVGIALAAILAGAVGVVVGGGVGAGAVWFLHLWRARVRESQDAEVQPEEELSSECGSLFAGFLVGSVLGCGAVLGLVVMVAE